jgi:hypothetical protein
VEYFIEGSTVLSKKELFPQIPQALIKTPGVKYRGNFFQRAEKEQH